MQYCVNVSTVAFINTVCVNFSKVAFTNTVSTFVQYAASFYQYRINSTVAFINISAVAFINTWYLVAFINTICAKLTIVQYSSFINVLTLVQQLLSTLCSHQSSSFYQYCPTDTQTAFARSPVYHP